MKNVNVILEGLKKEIDQTLMFFVSSDLKIYGYITTNTVECFAVQNRKFPEALKGFINYKN